MTEHAHKLEIFRGLIKFKSNTQKIWGVLLLLSVITAVEVVLGIYKPDILMVPSIQAFEGGLSATFLNIILSPFIYTKSLNLIFIILTVVKAYYITWDFMHMRDETKSLRRLVVWTAVFLICYLVFILLQEGGYIESIYTDGFIKRDF
ncbi:MAG: cytochrome C oxidase subunit IV family protein [Bacteroidota bacterium]|nr:cytochrome C oxidase subunit IV family protein [Bacteroidota bacterium]